MMNTKLIVLAAILVASANTRAQPTRDPASSERSTAAVKPPAIDPDAIAALTRMAAFLRDQRSFTVHARRETDEVLESGQKVLLTSTITIDARRPDRLRADVTSDRKERQYFYDGKTLTLNSPRMGFYATVPAAPKIGTVLDELAQRYGIEFPLADLFYWGTEKASTDQITSAIDVGPSRIGGVDTEQYAFRQPGLDWQIWIERGASPLPRKLALTTTDDPARPQYVADLDWVLDAKHDDARFTFVPSKDSHKIDLAELPERGAPAKQRSERPGPPPAGLSVSISSTRHAGTGG